MRVRVNEAGDSVPSSQESVTRAIQNLRISDHPSGLHGLPAPPTPAVGNPRRQPRPKQQPREYLRCAQCGSDPAAHVASSDHGLMLRMGQEHGGQRLLSKSIGQLRHLDRGPCMVCGATRSRRCNRCSFCNSHTPLRELLVGDTFQDRRQPGHQDVARRGTSTDQQLLQSSQPVPSRRTSGRQTVNCPVRDVVVTERDKQPLPASAVALPRCVLSRYATAWAESLDGAMSGHQSWALICRCRCRLLLAEIPKGVDRNSELKQRLQLWESGKSAF